MNIIHKVAVLFHSQDRLSRSMDHIAGGFDKLNDKQKEFEKHQKLMAKTAEQRGKMFQQLQTKEQMWEMKRQQMKNQAWAETQRIGNAEYAFRQAHAGRMKAIKEQQASHQMAMEARVTKFEEAQAALRGRFATQRDRVTNQHEGARTRMGARRTAITDLAQFGGRGQIMTPDELARSRGNIVRDRAAIQAVRRTRDLDLRALSAGTLLTPDGEAIEDTLANQNRIKQAANAAMSGHKSTMAEDRLRVTDHRKILQLNADILASEQAQAREIGAINALQSRFLEEQRIAEKEISEAQAAGHHARVESLRDEAAQKLVNHNRTMGQLEAEQKLTMDMHGKKIAMMEEEERVMRRETAILAAQNRMQDVKNAKMAEELELARKRSAAMGHITGGAGMVGAGAMGLGGLVWAGNHLVHKAAEDQNLQSDIKLNLWGQTTNGKKGGPLWSDIINRQIDKNNDMIPGTNLVMTGLQQRQIVEEQLGAAIKPGEALKMLPSIATAVRLFESKHKSTANIGGDLATILERSGAMTSGETAAVLDQIVKSANVSSRFTTAALRAIMIRSSSMRSMHMNMKDFSIFDFLLAGDPSGSRGATQWHGFMNTFSRGGIGIPAKKEFALMYKMGFFKSVKMPNGSLAPMANDLTGYQVPDKMREFALRRVGITHDQFWKGTLTPAQIAKLSHQGTLMVGNTRGGDFFQNWLNPVEAKRAQMEQQKKNASLGLFGSMAAKDSQYNIAVANAKKQADALTIALGKDVLPMMTKTMKEITGILKGMTDWAKKNGELANGIAETIKYVALLTIGLGGARIAMGAFNFALMGFPGKLIGALIPKVQWAIVSAVADLSVIPLAAALTGVFVSAVGGISIAAIVAALIKGKDQNQDNNSTAATIRGMKNGSNGKATSIYWWNHDHPEAPMDIHGNWIHRPQDKFVDKMLGVSDSRHVVPGPGNRHTIGAHATSSIYGLKMAQKQTIEVILKVDAKGDGHANQSAAVKIGATAGSAILDGMRKGAINHPRNTSGIATPIGHVGHARRQ